MVVITDGGRVTRPTGMTSAHGQHGWSDGRSRAGTGENLPVLLDVPSSLFNIYLSADYLQGDLDLPSYHGNNGVKSRSICMVNVSPEVGGRAPEMKYQQSFVMPHSQY